MSIAMETITHEQACNIFAAMVEDAKQTMIMLHQVSMRRELKPYEKVAFQESQRWLMDGNGGLSDLLIRSGVAKLATALEDLREFATEGYKTHQFIRRGEYA